MTDEIDMDADPSASGSCLGLLVSVLLIPWEGFVVACLWGWFVVPLGVPAITLWHGTGLAVLGGLVAAHHHPAYKAEGTVGDLLRRITLLILRPTIVLGVGFVAHLLT